MRISFDIEEFEEFIKEIKALHSITLFDAGWLYYHQGVTTFKKIKGKVGA